MVRALAGFLTLHNAPFSLWVAMAGPPEGNWVRSHLMLIAGVQARGAQAAIRCRGPETGYSDR